jgi:exopolyphosphatase/guanosine-5'-triphosphate,3'-diphosphate pyrophosphatase
MNQRRPAPRSGKTRAASRRGTSATSAASRTVGPKKAARPRKASPKASRKRARPTSGRTAGIDPKLLLPRYGVVDVGSNAIRMQVIEVREGGEPHVVLETRREPVRLGQDVFLTGAIPETSIAKAIEALRSFRLACDRWQVRGVRAVATSALREAANRDAILRRLQRETGVHVEVISGTEEAYLLVRGVEARVDLSEGRSMLVDVGGGSVEVTLVENGQIAVSESYRLGAVRLLEALTRDVRGAKDADFLALLDQYVGSLDRRIAERLGSGKIDRFVATGGNIETLGDLAARETPLRETDGVESLPRKTLSEWIQRLARLSYAERVEEFGLAPDRADVVLPAAVVYYRLAEVGRVDRLLIPRVGLRDGLVREIVSGHLETAQASDRRETVMAGATALARKYHADLEHAEKVRQLAVSLFDQLVSRHGLGAEERVLLEAAAMLHDIGAFVSASAHHKHAHYLIRSSDLVGLSESEREIVALVARYHRRSHPKRTHLDFHGRAREERDRVVKIAAILRLADALDREHQTKVARVEATIGGRHLDLVLEPVPGVGGDLALEHWAVRRKGSLFLEVFGLQPRVVS